jgi:sulfotransferase
MEKGLHFIAGLPRSGSTLLAAILRQNPAFHAAMSSPVSTLFMAMQSAASRRHEESVFIDEQQKIELFRGIFNAYYHAIHPKKLVFDTNRAWCSKLPALVKIFPDAKFVCCVRNVSWILDSFERIIQSNPLDLSGMFGYDPSTTVYTRTSRLAGSDGVVGYSLDALREAFFGPHADRLLLIDYEALVRNPEFTLRALYEFVDQPWFKHDFNSLDYQAQEFDLALGTPNLHTVRSRVEWIERNSVLPPHVFERFSNDAFWTDPALNINNVRVLLG